MFSGRHVTSYPGASRTAAQFAGPVAHIARHAELAGFPKPGPAPTGGTKFNEEVQTITSATTMAPTGPGEWLTDMVLYPGGDISWLELTVKSPYKQIFPARLAGLDATGAIGVQNPTRYRMNWYIPGTTGIASGNQTFGGGLQAVDFVYGPGPKYPEGINLDENTFLGEANEADETGTSGTATTYTFTAGKAIPKWLIALTQNEATATGIPRARIQMPAIGGYARASYPCEAPIGGTWPTVNDLGTLDPALNIVLTHKVDSLGGATNVGVGGFLYYIPVGNA